MALFDRSSTRSFLSEIAHEQDICQYCEKAIREKNKKKELNFDEMHRELRSLKGKITGKRVMKFRYLGHEFCVCPTCLKNVYTEVQNFNKEKEELIAPVIEDIVQADSTNEASTKTVRGKNNATKKN